MFTYYDLQSTFSGIISFLLNSTEMFLLWDHSNEFVIGMHLKTDSSIGHPARLTAGGAAARHTRCRAAASSRCQQPPLSSGAASCQAAHRVMSQTKSKPSLCLASSVYRSGFYIIFEILSPCLHHFSMVICFLNFPSRTQLLTKLISLFHRWFTLLLGRDTLDLSWRPTRARWGCVFCFHIQWENINISSDCNGEYIIAKSKAWARSSFLHVLKCFWGMKEMPQNMKRSLCSWA